MPKRTASTRGGASRNRPKAQKSIQLVRPDAAESETETQRDESGVEEETTTAASTAKATAANTTATVARTETATGKKSSRESSAAQAQEAVEETAGTPGKGSAAARLAARRQNQNQPTLKPATSRNVSLISAEHYAYVRRDLVYILILAIIMFSTIIILHFVPAIGG